MNKKIKNNGITLISLVITIIIMLILVGVSITLAVNGGLFEYAGKAVGDTENAMKQEQELINDIMNNHIKPHTKKDEGTTPENPDEGETISTSESYIGYYADIDGDGTVDGVIYADLVFSKSGIWNNNSLSNYEYKAQDNLKKYVVSENSYEGVFGTQPIIKVKANSKEGTDRFYVMALEEIKATIDGTECLQFYWYREACGKLDRIVDAGYNDFGEGKRNTIAWLKNWNTNTATYGEQNVRDLWGVIQNSENESDSGKWFVPSKAEWSAFGDYLYTKLGVTKGDNGAYKLYSFYWTSSIESAYNSYYADIEHGFISTNNVIGESFVRLSATF